MRFVTRLLATARELWPHYLAITICSVLGAGVGLVSPFLIKAATDRLVAITSGGPRLITPLIWIAVGLLVVEAARSVISNIAGYLGDVMSSRLRATLSTRYFNHLLRLPQRYLDNEQTGTVIGRLNRSITEVAQFLNVFANNMFPMLLSLVASLAVMAWYSWPIALLVLLMYPVFTWLTALTSKKWQVLEKAKNAEIDIANGRFAEAVTQLRVVKSFVAEVRELRHFSSRYVATIGLTTQQSRFWHAMDIARQVALNVIFFAIYVVIFIQTASGSYTVGTMVLLVQMVTMARMPVTSMSYLVDTAQRAVAGSRDYFAVMAEPVETEVLPTPDAASWAAVAGAPAVAFRNLTFGYADGPAVLDGVNFDIAPGERIAFVGDSGGGKTTLVSLLLRLYEPRSGQILIDGLDIAGVDHGAVRQHVGVVFQDPSLFSGTIRENIAYGDPSRTDEHAIEEAARRAHVQPFVDRLPKRYDTEIGERGLKLSGGQKQRDRPRAAQGRAHPGAGRGDELSGHQGRAAGTGRPRRAHDGPDDPHHRPPALDDLVGRPHRHTAGGPRRRDRHAGRARRQGRHLQRAARAAGVRLEGRPPSPCDVRHRGLTGRSCRPVTRGGRPLRAA